MTTALRYQRAAIAILAPIATAGIGLAATAHAATEYLLFTSPSGNVKCEMTTSYKGDPYANCVVRHAAYAVPADKCDFSGSASPALHLIQENAPTLSCVVGSDDTPGEFTLDLGQTRSFGTITCDSEDFSVTCTDAGTGHYLRAGTGSYDLG